jgi:hypothetical protein
MARNLGPLERRRESLWPLEHGGESRGPSRPHACLCGGVGAPQGREVAAMEGARQRGVECAHEEGSGVRRRS